MISSDVIRGYNDTILLGLLLRKDGYGYELSREIQTRTAGAYPIKETTLYSAINRLQKNGYISAYQGTETLGKPRTYYTITDQGRAYYKEKCTEWAVTKRVIDLFTSEEEIE